MNRVKKIFKRAERIVIGVIHFPPLIGYPKFPGLDVALQNALKDLRAFERGGVDGIMFENNYDIPHREQVDPGVVAAMTYLGGALRSEMSLPLGVSVLWNDYRAALGIAKVLGLEFVRIPVFVDKVSTDYGVFMGVAREARQYRKHIMADDVAILADVHVKHARLLSKASLETSATRAVAAGADALILTGHRTGAPPDEEEVGRVREAVGRFPIFIGSGVTTGNARSLLKYSNGVIVSTSLKRGGIKSGEINVKSYTQRIDAKKVRTLVSQVKP